MAVVPVAASRAASRAAWQQLLGALSALTVLALLLPGPVRCVELLRGQAPGLTPGAGTSSAGASPIGETAMLLVAALVVWSLLLWGSVVALAALTTRLPGRAGRSGRVMLARLAPGAARRVLLTTVGVSMVTGLAACGTGTATAASVKASGSPDVARSSMARAIEDAVAGTGIPGQAASWTSVEGSAVQLRSDLMDPAGGSEAGPSSQMNIDWPTLPGHSGSPGLTGSAAPKGPVDIDWPDAGTPVVVLRGDSLWSIAANHLPPGAPDSQIELASRAWYDANISVIGDDPDLILPGQILQPPNQEKGH